MWGQTGRERLQDPDAIQHIFSQKPAMDGNEVGETQVTIPHLLLQLRATISSMRLIKGIKHDATGIEVRLFLLILIGL